MVIEKKSNIRVGVMVRATWGCFAFNPNPKIDAYWKNFLYVIIHVHNYKQKKNGLIHRQSL